MNSNNLSNCVTVHFDYCNNTHSNDTTTKLVYTLMALENSISLATVSAKPITAFMEEAFAADWFFNSVTMETMWPWLACMNFGRKWCNICKAIQIETLLLLLSYLCWWYLCWYIVVGTVIDCQLKSKSTRKNSWLHMTSQKRFWNWSFILGYSKSLYLVGF